MVESVTVPLNRIFFSVGEILTWNPMIRASCQVERAKKRLSLGGWDPELVFFTHWHLGNLDRLMIILIIWNNLIGILNDIDLSYFLGWRFHQEYFQIYHKIEFRTNGCVDDWFLDYTVISPGLWDHHWSWLSVVWPNSTPVGWWWVAGALTTLYILKTMIYPRTGNPELNQPGSNGMIEGFGPKARRNGDFKASKTVIQRYQIAKKSWSHHVNHLTWF